MWVSLRMPWVSQDDSDSDNGTGGDSNSYNVMPVVTMHWVRNRSTIVRMVRARAGLGQGPAPGQGQGQGQGQGTEAMVTVAAKATTRDIPGTVMITRTEPR